MADKYIGDITKKTPNLVDYLVAVDGADAYQTLVSDVAKKIIEDYQGSNLGGVAQSIQAGFDVVSANNIVGANARQGWTALTTGQDINEVTTAGIYYAQTNVLAQSLVNSPYKYAFKLVVEHSLNGNGYLKQSAYLAGWANGPLYQGEAAETFIWRKSINGGTTWSEWIDQPQRSEVNAIANRGGKNLLPNNIVSQTVNGLTVTKNADGSVTINGTATANTRLYMWNSQLQASPFEAGDTFLMSGCNGGSTETYRIQLLTNGTIRANCFDGDVTATIPANTTATQTVQFAIQVLNGTVMNNVTFYPMLRYSSIQDDTFVPYGMSNAELTEDAVLQSTTITATIGGVASSWVVRKRYKTVEFTLTTGNVLANAQNGDVIMTLPEGYRPSTTVYIPIMMIKGSWETAVIKPCLLAIATNGTVTLRAATADIQASGSLFGTVSFITA